ncbi:hypothetical protein [Paludisphaera rhizosphaerae]|uniref:hypothetical protein n=1 Tax=Paludisphaera rhizosphaerae TaxID=2711216 RepID=UPI00197DF99C|nr:hypothetical protein [Paludisphaera rhizosphaerae]
MARGDEAPLKAGVARRVVTPPVRVPYLTSSAQATNAPFGGVHDDLHARALVLDGGRNSLALLTVDSIGYDNALLGPGRDFTRELRERVAAKTGLEPGSILLAASHTHSAPETIGLTPFRDVAGVPDWIESHLNDLVATVVEAWERRVPVRARFGSRRVDEVARYRRIVLKDGRLNRAGALPTPEQTAEPWALDEDLSVLYLETLDGHPHAVVLNYTAHPVIAMLLPPVSADYPGAATALVETQLPGAVCLFTQGAAGNINSRQVSTNFDDVGATGRRLGAAAMATIDALKTSPPTAIDALDVRSQVCELEGRPCPSVEEAARLAEAQPNDRNRRLARLARKLSEEPLRAEVQVMRLGPLTWVGLPGEPFVETGLALKKAGASFVVGYANGYLGYLPIRRAYDEGGYEADPGPWSRVGPGSAERLQEIAERLLQEIRRPAG